MKIRVPSYAKINWFLDIKGKRADGFHEILTLFQTISLSDTLFFQVTGEDIHVDIQGRAVPGGEENLVYRAADLLGKKSGVRGGARITLRKKIPMAAGLGGGSSNAAVALLVLNRLWDCGQGIEDLREIAGELGSDVPYFLFGGARIGWGRGTETLPAEGLETEREILLIYPGFGVPTAEAYSLLDKPDVEISPELTRDCLRHTIRRSEEIIESGDYSCMNNDFEGPVFEHFPGFRRIISRLGGSGPGKIMLSGSGSALIVIGEHSFLREITSALKNMGQDVQGLEVFRCRTVSRKSYQAYLGEFLSYADANSRLKEKI